MSRRVKVCSVMLWGVFCAQPPFAQALAAQASAAPAPAPAATLYAVQIPPGPHPETLLHVQAPGRFALRTQSPSGTALELIDMVTGPTRTEGEPGAKDGRLDLLLDQGTYKVRLHPAPNAAAPIRLAVTPFTDAAPPATLEPDSEAHATLADFQQRSVWFAVAANSPPIRLEAAGRALADLQLWRNGRDLVPITPTADTTIEPTKLHPLHDILIAQSLPPGTYLATAYGGPALPWADGATAMPFHIRLGAAQTLRPGWVAATVGPFGSALYNTVGSDDLVRLSMAGPATLQVDSDSTAINTKSRVPEATLQTRPQAQDHLVEVQGPEGTPYRLRSTRIGQGTTESRAGTYWVTGNTDGLGGDNVPATLILALRDRGSFTVLGSNAPEIGPRTAWRRRFSMGAETSILFHVETGGMVAAALTGLATLPPTVAALDTERDVPPPDPAHPAQWDLAPGWYALSFMPAHGAAGVADLTIGPPGVTVPPGPPGPPSPSITFGAQAVGYRQSLVLLGNAAAGTRLGLEARPFPVDLGSTPLRVSQDPGAALRIPVVQHAWPPQAVEINRGPVPVQTPTPTTVELPPADHPRTVALLQSAPRPAGPPPVPAPDSARPSLQDGTPAFFDFAEATPRAFSLAVAKGGLFHVETLGRLRTRSAIGTHFVPELASADANGPGQNTLLQTFLRAGAYHVDVTAEASAGHAGIVAFPAPLLASPSLLPGGTIRATLPPGSGLAVPLEIAAQGTYRLDLLGLNRTFTARLEDAEGWPLAVSAPLSTVTQDLSPGTYRLLVMPQPTAARAVARLIRIEPATARSGHGPFPLPFENTQAYTWREPPGRDDPRVPDRWRFTLAAPADVTLDLGDGMQADLLRDGGPAPVAHLAGGTPLARTLPPGNYTLEATSQGRNDRLGYTIGLSATQLQPGIPRAVTLPGSASFALAGPRIVSLTSFGATPVRATLKASDGHVIARIGARQNDWNLALSRLLPAGTYTLDAADAAPPPQQPTPPNPNDQPAPSADAPDGAPADAPDDTAGGAPNDAATDASGAAADTSNGAADAPSGAAPDAPADAEPAPRTPNASGPDQDNAAAPPPSGTTELTLALPADAPPATLIDGAATLTGGGVHHLPLPPAAPNQLILAGAASTEAAVISLEQQTPAGGWQSRAQAQGLAPILAMQPDATPGAWRLSVWPVDGGALPIRAAARIVDDAAAEGQPHLRRTPLPGVAPALCTAHVQAPAGRPLLHLQGKGAILAATWPGHEAAAPNANLIAPQGPDIWLIAHGPGAMALSPAAPAAPLAITLARGETATLPSPANTLAAWIAEGQGQPGLAGNSAMGVTDNAALVLSTGAPVTLWNAGDDETLRIAAKAVTLIQAPSQPSEGDHILPPASATPIAMPPGAHTIRLDLPPGTAMVAAGTPAAAAPAPAAAVTVWAGPTTISRTIQGEWPSLLLINTTRASAGVGLALETTPSVAALTPARAYKRFFGTAGAFDLPVTAAPGQTLIAAGDATATFVPNAAGIPAAAGFPAGDGAGPGTTTGPGNARILRGTRLALPGPGRVTIQHGPGLVAVWLEGPNAAPWPAPTVVPANLPGSLPLNGEAMALALAPKAPCLLSVRTTAPVILALAGAQPTLFPAGAALTTYLPAAATLRILSPQDGPLSGTLTLAASPLRPATEGLGQPTPIAPGGAALFAFHLNAAGRIGIGVQAQPDRVSLRLLTAAGRPLATGAAMLQDLAAGDYVLEASIPADAPATLVRPAIVGLAPRPDGPPADVIQSYRVLAGMVSSKGKMQ